MHAALPTHRRSLPFSARLRPSLLAALCLVAGLWTGCGGERNEPAAPAGPEPLYFEPIGSGQRATLADTVAAEVAIRDAETWAAYRDSLRSPGPFKDVDFSQAMVLLAARPQTTGGYSIEFSSVEQTDTAIVATYVLSVPDTDCLTAATRTEPFAAVLVRRAEGPVRFVHTREDYRCTFGPRR